MIDELELPPEQRVKPVRHPHEDSDQPIDCSQRRDPNQIARMLDLQPAWRAAASVSAAGSGVPHELRGAGEIAQCDLWFPPITLPVGFGQIPKRTQLPVLTMVCRYSRWLLAVLIPSRRAEDLFAGWWRLIEPLGAVPRVLAWPARVRPPVGAQPGGVRLVGLAAEVSRDDGRG